MSLLKRYLIFFGLALALVACNLQPTPTPAPTAAPTATHTPEPTHTSTPEPTATPTAEPTSTPLPAELTVTIDETLNLMEIDAQASLVFYFNQPMDVDSTPKPIVFVPHVDGSYEWSADGLTVTFTPEEPFPVNRTINAQANARLVSMTGEKFPTNRLPKWSLVMIDGPAVIIVSPADKTQLTILNPTITLKFNTSVNQESVEQALQLPEGQTATFNWLNDQELSFTLSNPLDFENNFSFSLNGDATAPTAVSTKDLPIQSRTWSYTLAPFVKSMVIPQATERTKPLSVQFNFPITEQSLTASWQMTPEVEGTLTLVNNNLAQFTPANKWPSATPISISFVAPLTSPTGESYPTPAEVKLPIFNALLEVYGGRDTFTLPSPQFITVTFDHPLDPNIPPTAVTFDPPLSTTLTVEENILYITFNQTLPVVAGTGYYGNSLEAFTLTLHPNILTSNGQPALDQPVSRQLSLASLKTNLSFGFGNNHQALDANGRRAVHFASALRAGSAYELLAYRYTEEALVQELPGLLYSTDAFGESSLTYLPVDKLELAGQWPMTTTAGLGGSYGQRAQELIIPPDLPPGFYIIELHHQGKLEDQLLLILTNYSLVVKQTNEQLWVWATDMAGQAASNLAVTIYDQTGRVLFDGSTDANGLYETALPLSETPPSFVMAGTGTNKNLISFGYLSTSRYVNYPSHLHTDRPIYQPGHTVYYKAMLRVDDDANNIVPPAGTPITVTITDPRGHTVQTTVHTTNSFGTINGEFTIAEGASLGNYKIQLQVPPDAPSWNRFIEELTFKVEEYAKPDYAVSILLDNNTPISGQQITVTVDSQYYFGEPVADALITARLIRPYQGYYWYEDDGFGGSNIEETFTGRTDANGLFTFSFTTTASSSSQSYYTIPSTSWIIDATVDDGTNRPVSGFKFFRTYSVAEKILITRNIIADAGLPFNVTLKVLNLQDQPVPGRVITFQISRYDSDSNNDKVVESQTLTTDEKGQAIASLTIPEAGYYTIYATSQDNLGHTIQQRQWLYLYQDNPPVWYGNQNASFTITADKESYVVGDVAELLVQTSYSGQAILTVQRGSVYREQLVQLIAPVTKLQLPIEEGDVPNVYATLSMWVSQNTQLLEEDYYYSSINDATLLTTNLNLPVLAHDKKLTVTITPAKETYAPGDLGSFTVKVTNYKGEPVSAELSLAMVDEAIFALSQDTSGPLYDAFYFNRYGSVTNYHSFMMQRVLSSGECCGMGGGGGGEGGSALGNQLRFRFPDTAAWYPALQTDANGEVTVQIVMPDSLTSWRLTARALTADTQVGEVIKNVTVRKDVIVRPSLPPQLTAGDTLLFSALLQNTGTEAATFDLVVTATNTDDLILDPVLTFADLPEGKITLLPNQNRMVVWSATAAQAGNIEFVLAAVRDGVVLDGVKYPLYIRPLAVPDVQTQIGDFVGSQTLTFEMPQDALTLSTVELTLSRSIAGSMLEGLEYLTGYPYGCVEQTMSRALPTAVVARAFAQLGLEERSQVAGLEDKVEAGVQRLYSFQHFDGGWGWWTDDDSHHYQTAWVVFGLANVAQAGYEVDPDVIDQGVAYLLDNLGQMDVKTQAYALYSITIAQAEPTPEVQTALITLTEEWDKLDNFAKFAVTLALWNVGETEQAQTLLAELSEGAIVENGQVHWVGVSGDGYYDSKTMASDIRTAGFALSVYSQMAPNNELVSGLVRYLMANRTATGWGTTNETAFAIIGLTDYLVVREVRDTEPINYTVTLNGEQLTTGVLSTAEPAVTLDLPFEALQSGNELVITQDSERELYYTLNRRALVAQEEIPAAGSLVITRTYQTLDGQTIAETDLRPGDVVEVVLEVQTAQQLSYVIVEDQLPAGFEALNERLNTTSYVATFDSSAQQYWWQEYGYNYKEIRDGRVSFFYTELAEGTTTVTYVVRVTMPGEFVAMPAEAYAMYDLTQWGRSASTVVVVQPLMAE